MLDIVIWSYEQTQSGHSSCKPLPTGHQVFPKWWSAHDFPIPGYKLITSGHMILTDYTEEDSKQVWDHYETFNASESDFCDSDKEDYEAMSSTPSEATSAPGDSKPPSQI